MNDRKFVNQFQPQTLFIATVLLYINAVFDFISFIPLFMLAAVALAAGGYGIANEKRWGYGLAVAERERHAAGLAGVGAFGAALMPKSPFWVLLGLSGLSLWRRRAAG